MTSWKITLTLPQRLIPPVTEIIYGLDPDDFPTLSDFEVAPKGFENAGKKRLLEAFFTVKPDLARLRHRLDPLLFAAGLSPNDISLSAVVEKNWVLESQKLLHPVDTGRFFIYGAHDRDRIPEGRISLLVEAGEAFGTGQHETTYGCLQAIEDLDRECCGAMPQSVLDLGCGSGVLALAMSKVWPTFVVASDIDRIATATTRANAEVNHVTVIDIKAAGRGVAIVTGDGFKDKDLSRAGPYDVIVANILAGPLRDMAADIVAHLSARGSLILSGLLTTQEQMIASSYARQGMSVIRHYIRGEWTSLMLRRTGP
ncbi:MAG: 50S ribosomal protein L11 methyltransferase [Alphaproteobacteria bacterium]|nr:50S ribosomal protein L11 methyltransferase [Alphaproteobacteria bacterium]